MAREMASIASLWCFGKLASSSIVSLGSVMSGFASKSFLASRWIAIL